MRMNRFLEKVALARLDGTFNNLLNTLEKIHLIIFDDFGLAPLTQDVKLAFLQILEDRYARKATIFASQIPVENWYECINEPTIADAILDRLIHTAYKIELKGENLRKKR